MAKSRMGVARMRMVAVTRIVTLMKEMRMEVAKIRTAVAKSRTAMANRRTAVAKMIVASMLKMRRVAATEQTHIAMTLAIVLP